MKGKLSVFICFFAAIVLVLSILPQTALPVQAAQTDPFAELEGLNLSILGDSISTMQNVSDGTGATSSNSTLPGASWYYKQDGARQNVKQADTWWQQTADQLGMHVLVNNSWSGSLLLAASESAGSEAAYLERVVQLHADVGTYAGETPDIIAFFLGTNDYLRGVSLGTYAAAAAKTLWTDNGDGTFTYETPVTTMEAYRISLHKISQAYPEAEVYCFTLLPATTTAQPTAFNAEIGKLVEATDHTYLVDLYNCGFQTDAAAHLLMSGDGVHPNKAGMDAITKAFISSILENSQYTKEYRDSLGLKSVQFRSGDSSMVAKYGFPRLVLAGDPLEVQLVPADMTDTVHTVTVTMDNTVVEGAYANGKVYIPAVTGDVVISAAASAQTTDKAGHTGHSAGWTAWNGDAAAMAEGGRFYLTGSTQVSDEILLDTNQEVVLCLNGQTLTVKGQRLFRIFGSSKVSVCDCTAHGEGDSYTAGTILGNPDSTASGSIAYLNLARASAAGRFDLYDGIIDGNGGNSAASGGSGMIASAGNAVNLYGGKLMDFTSSKGGAVYGAEGAKICVDGDVTISGCNATSLGGAIYIAGSTLTADGLTITDCHGTAANSRGGAIYMDGSSTAVISDSAISDCSAMRYGGAIFCNGSTLTIDNTSISGCSVADTTQTNTDEAGGAVYTNNYSTVTIRNHSTIQNCHADREGGAVYTYTSGLTISDSTITGCDAGTDADGSGGALFARKTTVTCSNVTLYGNSTTKRGGAVCLPGCNDDTTITLTGCTFEKNKTTSSSAGCGGALYVGKGTANLKSVTMTGNENAGSLGSAISVGENNTYTSSVSLEDCTITNNTNAQSDGRAAVVVFSGNHTLTVSGSTRIDDNTNNGVECNVLLRESTARLTIGVLTSGASIRVDSQFAVTAPADFLAAAGAGGCVANEKWLICENLEGDPSVGYNSIDGFFYFSDKEDQGHRHGACACAISGAVCGHTETADSVYWAEWTSADSLPANAGYYYLTKDVALSSQYQVSGKDVYICLNGKSIRRADGAAFLTALLRVQNGQLTILNCGAALDADGMLSSSAGIKGGQSGGAEAGAIRVDTNGTLTLLGVELSNNSSSYENATANHVGWTGGAIMAPRTDATVNIAYAAFKNNQATGVTDGCGGAINWGGTGTANIRNTVFSDNTAAVNGGAIFVNNSGATVNLTDCVFTGNTAANGSAVYGGTTSKLNLSGITAEGEACVKTGGLVQTGSPVTLGDGRIVKLAGNAATVSASESDLYLDLNGHDVGTLTIAGGTLYGLDSATDDYDCTDGYGVIANIEGEYAPTQRICNGAYKRYLAIAEQTGTSFHRYYVGITSMTLQPGCAGAGYTLTVAGDGMVQENITSFGFQVSLSENMSGAISAEDTDLTFADGIATKRLIIQNILSGDNSAEENKENGNMKLYVKAHVTFENGEKTEAPATQRTMKELVEAIDKMVTGLTDVQKAALASMYARCKMDELNWDIKNIAALAA